MNDGKMSSSRISSISNYGKTYTKSKDASFYSEISPTKSNKVKSSVIELSKSPSLAVPVLQGQVS